MSPFTLLDFVAESNAIEGIGSVEGREIEAHKRFLATGPTLYALRELVADIADASLRERQGMDVRVGNHRPPRGSAQIRTRLENLLGRIQARSMTPYDAHREYETLHPFMDGNGRSGRAIWLSMMGGISNVPLGFLHTWYYQSLGAAASVGGPTVEQP